MSLVVYEFIIERIANNNHQRITNNEQRKKKREICRTPYRILILN